MALFDWTKEVFYMGGPVFCFTETGVRYNVTPIQKKKKQRNDDRENNFLQN